MKQYNVNNVWRLLGVALAAVLVGFSPLWAADGSGSGATPPAGDSAVAAPTGSGSGAASGSGEGSAAVAPGGVAVAPASGAVTVEGLLRSESIADDDKFGKQLGDLEKKDLGPFSGKDLAGLLKSKLKRLVLLTNDQTYVLIFADKKLVKKLGKHAGSQLRCVGTAEPPAEGKKEQRFNVTEFTLLDDAGQPIPFDAGSGSGSGSASQ